MTLNLPNIIPASWTRLIASCRSGLLRTHQRGLRAPRFRPAVGYRARIPPATRPRRQTCTVAGYPVDMEKVYAFPDDKIQKLQNDSKTPLVLISCGSFSPVTFLHLRMFEMCVDFVREHTDFEVVAGYLCPVADAYKKPGLAPASDRLEMCNLAAAESEWLMVDGWEAAKDVYTRTALVLDHFYDEINGHRDGVEVAGGGRKPARICLLSGSDLIQTMSDPGVWAPEDLDHILGRYGAFIIERYGTSTHDALTGLETWRRNIHCITQFIQNDVSSTKIRYLVQSGMSIRYLVPDSVRNHISHRGLFRELAKTLT